MSYKPRPQDVVFLATGVCSLLFGLTLGLSEAEWFLREGSYWILLISAGAFLFSLWRLIVDHREELVLKLESHFHGWFVLFFLLVTVAVYLLQPSGYKVVMDEPLLVASSRQMHLERELYVPQSCYELGGAFYNFDGYFDKRPGFYPFLLSLLHSLTGYRSSQGMVLNAMLVPFFVLVLSFLCDRLWPGRGKYLGPLLLLTVPLFPIVANGSGFDFLNLVLLCILLQLALLYHRCPGTSTLNALFWAFVLVAHTRYESALYLLPVLLIIGLGFLRAGRSCISWLTCLVPVVLAPLILLIRLIGRQDDPLQIREGDTVAFSLDYLSRNLSGAVEFFFQFGSDQPNSWLLTALFCLAVFFVPFAVWLRRGSSNPEKRSAMQVYVLMGVGLSGYIAMISAYHWGQLNDFAATRLALPIIIAKILIVVAVFGVVLGQRRVAWGLPVLCVGYLAVVTVPGCLKTDFLDDYPPARRAIWLKSKALEYKEENVLFIAQQRLVPVVEEVSSISIGRALGAKERLALHHQLRTFSRILVVQLLMPAEGGDMVEEIPLREHFELEELERHSVGRGQEVALSELKVVYLTAAEKDRLNPADYAAYDLPMDWFRIIPETLP